MPQYGLRGARVAQYNNNNGAVTYGQPKKAGCAITAQLELRFAEARLYACDTLAEYLREVIGGNVTFGAKYFPQDAQLLMFGASTKSRSVSYAGSGGTTTTSTVTSIVTSANDEANYVGFACYCPDMVDGVRKWTCFFVAKAKFSPPSYTLNTKGETINFQTPQTVGEFLPDDAGGMVVQEVAICDSEAEADAWCDTVFPQS